MGRDEEGGPRDDHEQSGREVVVEDVLELVSEEREEYVSRVKMQH